MELQIAGTNTEIPPAIQRYVERKLSRLSKHLPDIIDIKVEVSEEKTRSPEQHYLVRATLSSGVGAVFHGEARAEDLMKAVDRVSNIMTRHSSGARASSTTAAGAIRSSGARRHQISRPGRRLRRSRQNVLPSRRCPPPRPSSGWRSRSVLSSSSSIRAPARCGWSTAAKMANTAWSSRYWSRRR